MLYKIFSDGRMLWHRHLQPGAGRPTWVNRGSGRVVNSGFQAFNSVVADGDGSFNHLYGIFRLGTVQRYVHSIELDGSSTWQERGGQMVRTGWHIYSTVVCTGLRRFYGVVA